MWNITMSHLWFTVNLPINPFCDNLFFFFKATVYDQQSLISVISKLRFINPCGGASDEMDDFWMPVRVGVSTEDWPHFNDLSDQGSDRGSGSRRPSGRPVSQGGKVENHGQWSPPFLPAFSVVLGLFLCEWQRQDLSSCGSFLAWAFSLV